MAHILPTAVVAAAMAMLASTAVPAQNAPQIFDFFLRQLENQAYQEQQRQLYQQHQNQQQHELNRLYQEFVAHWSSCHDTMNVHACDAALSYPFISPNDHQRLLSKRAAIVSAEDDQRRARDAEAERLRVQEERRLAAARAFTAAVEGCRRYDSASCDRALVSSLASDADRTRLSAFRAVAVRFVADRSACRDGSAAACDAALASPAADNHERALIAEWRARASPVHRVLAVASEAWSAVRDFVYALPAAVRDLPPSTQITGTIAAALTLALAGIGVRRRRRGQPPPTDGAQARAGPPPLPPHFGSAQEEPAVTGTPSAEAPQAPESSSPPQPHHQPRDTPAAIQALELAHAYLDEVREAPRPAFDATDTRKQHLNTLALAAKQLDAAQKLDPDAMLEGQDDRDIPYRFSIDELKAEALLLEGLTHQTYDIKRAIPALRRATTLNSSSPTAFYVLGLTHAASRNKAEAVAAFERAVALDPKNITYRKELNRVESLSAAEIAGYKATRAGEKIFDAGIKTANAGIMAWNIFAVLWNIVTFPLRLVFGIFRFLGLAGFR